jgi:small conductance mechanosensitive channel
MKSCLTYCSVFWILLVGSAFAQPAESNPLKGKETEIRAELAKSQEALLQTEEQMDGLPEEDREIFEMEEEQQALATLQLLYQLSENLRQQEKAEFETTELRTFISTRMERVPDIVLRALDRNDKRLKSLRTEKKSAEVSELGVIEEQLGTIEASVDRLHEVAILHVGELDQLGIETSEFKQKIDDSLRFRSRLMAGRLRKSIADRTILKNRVSANSDDSNLALRLAAVQVTIDSSARSLDRLIKLMDKRKMDVTVYKTILIQTTGDISRGFDLGVLWKVTNSGASSLSRWAQKQLPGLMTKFLVLAVIMFFFHLLAKVVQKGITRTVQSARVNVSKLLGRMIANTSYRVVLVLGILIALMQIGISLTPLLAGIGVAGFIVGFALQDTLGNFASGMMILFYRPFDEHDFVEAGGVRGRVNKMSLVSTTILTLDNQTLIVPNSKIWGDVICNVTDQATRRVDLKFGVSYGSDIPQVESIIKEIIASNEKILAEPETQIKVHELGDSSVNFVVRPWVKTEDYWEVYWFMTREVKIRFDKEGISIPFPQRDVHHYYPHSGGGQPPA